MKQALFLYTLPPDIRIVMMGPRLSVTFDEGTEIPTTYQEQIEVLRPKLELPEVIQHIIDDGCLLDDEECFDGDETFVFDKVEYRDFRLVYSFKNKDGHVVEEEFLIETSRTI